jgi:hypothetical protein
MRRLIVLTVTIIICVGDILAQQTKPCQFIGVYNKEINGKCIVRAIVHEDVTDYAEYVLKKDEFAEQYKKANANPRFLRAHECVIVYEYEKAGPGNKCSSTLIGIKTGNSLDACRSQLANGLAKDPTKSISQPRIIFSWQGKDAYGSSEYIKDYGGLSGRFISGNTSTQSIIMTQLTNKTTDKLATVLVRTDDGKMSVEYLDPGSTLTVKYSTKQLEIQVLYQDYKTPKPSFDTYEFIKNKVREAVINENGKFKSQTYTTVGVRG